MEWLLALHRRLHEDDAAMSAGVNTGNEPLAALAATTTAEHAHHHMDPSSSPPPACRHCWWGHIAPGSYLLWLAALLFLEALAVRHRPVRLRGVSPRGVRSAGGGDKGAVGGEPTAAGWKQVEGGWTVRQRAVLRMRVWSALVAGPLLALGEGMTHKAWHGGNVQHFTIYTLITLDGLVAGLRRRWPRGLLGVWEAGSLALVGFQMQSHFHGGPMISRMHALMCPALTLVGALLFTDRVFGPALPSLTREGLRLGACVAMASVALWFGSIGPGFWQYGGESGWFGTSWEGGGGSEMDHETMMTLSTLATGVFLLAFAGVATLWGLVAGEPTIGEGGEEEEEEGEEEGMGSGYRHKRGGYVELSKRGASVDAAAGVGGRGDRRGEDGLGVTGDEEEAVVL